MRLMIRADRSITEYEREALELIDYIQTHFTELATIKYYTCNASIAEPTHRSKNKLANEFFPEIRKH